MVGKASLIFKVQYEDEMEPKRRVEESSGWRGHEVRAGPVQFQALLVAVS